MKIRKQQTVEVDAKYLKVSAGVRYWEDGEVNGMQDTDGTLIPMREGDYWCPMIEINSGIIMGWPDGTTADVHYKICDDGEYELIDKAANVIGKVQGYVPGFFPGSHFGDYIIFRVNGGGVIEGWDADAESVANTFFQ